MDSMFQDTKSFNQDLESWNVSDKTSTRHMFDRAIALENTPSWYKKSEW